MQGTNQRSPCGKEKQTNAIIVRQGLAALLLASGCHPVEPRSAPSVPVTTPAVQALPEPTPPELAAPAPLVGAPRGDAPAAPTSDASAAPVHDAPAGPGPDAPAKPLQKIATWPFTAWDRAEAVTFNHVAYGPGIALRAYDDVHGWSPKLVERRAITPQQGARAVQWVIATRGEVEVSKCAFPRHAVVLYAGDTPVGTANVCFECGDILVWPAFDRAPEQQRSERAWRQQLTAYKKVFPLWEQFFRDELGFSLTPNKSP